MVNPYGLSVEYFSERIASRTHSNVRLKISALEAAN